MADTHISSLKGRFRVSNGQPEAAATANAGQFYWDSGQKSLFRSTGNTWIGFAFTAGTAATAGPASTPSTGTHYSSLTSGIQETTTAPTLPEDGDFYYDTANDYVVVYDRTAASWYTASLTTTTSTSTSTTTTSTSTTTTSTSTSSSTSTSVTTSTSTTTTL